jgi:hypothetical protein
VISGGYGLAHGDELIGIFDRLFHAGDRPPGLLESLLVREADQLGVRNVVAFSAATSDYDVPVTPDCAHDCGRCPLYVHAQLETMGLSWIPRDLARPKATARKTGKTQLTSYLRRWWQVLGSNQRRLSRRFYRRPALMGPQAV